MTQIEKITIAPRLTFETLVAGQSGAGRRLAESRRRIVAGAHCGLPRVMVRAKEACAGSDDRGPRNAITLSDRGCRTPRRQILFPPELPGVLGLNGSVRSSVTGSPSISRGSFDFSTVGSARMTKV